MRRELRNPLVYFPTTSCRENPRLPCFRGGSDLTSIMSCNEVMHPDTMVASRRYLNLGDIKVCMLRSIGCSMIRGRVRHREKGTASWHGRLVDAIGNNRAVVSSAFVRPLMRGTRLHRFVAWLSFLSSDLRARTSCRRCCFVLEGTECSERRETSRQSSGRSQTRGRKSTAPRKTPRTIVGCRRYNPTKPQVPTLNFLLLLITLQGAGNIILATTRIFKI